MSGTPVNLNKLRKARARAADKARAAENTVAFGRSKAEKSQAAQEAYRSGRDLDGKAMDRDAEPERTP